MPAGELEIMSDAAWRIYLAEIPHARGGIYWVSSESDPALKQTKANIYGRCLPCIQNLYEHLREERKEIELGRAFHCWKITAVVRGLDEALALLGEFEKRYPGGHVYGRRPSGGWLCSQPRSSWWQHYGGFDSAR